MPDSGGAHVVKPRRGRKGRHKGVGYLVAFTTILEPESRVDADVSLVGRSLEVEGLVGRSVWVVGATIRATGAIGRDLTVRAHELHLVAPARIGGNVTAHVERQSDVRREPGVTIGGTRATRLAPPGSSVYAEPRSYFWFATNLFGALLVAFVALALVPRFFHGSVGAVGAWWRSFGLGAAVLVAGPILMTLVALTLVGLPLALVSLALYLLGLYVAKIVVGAFVGRAVLRSASTNTRDSFPALLAYSS